MILNGLVDLVSSRNRHAAVVLLLDYSTPFQPSIQLRLSWQELVEMAIQKMTAWQSYRRVHRLSPEPRTKLVGEMLVKYRVIPLIYRVFQFEKC